MKRLKNLKFIFLALGILLFWKVVASIETESLKNILPCLSGSGWTVFLIYPFMCLWDVWAWQYVFITKFRKKLNFFTLYWIRLAGEAVNNVTPFVDIGGEPFKALFVVRTSQVPNSAAISSVIVGRTALLAAEIIFGILGIVLAMIYLDIPTIWQYRLGFVVLVLIGVVIAALSIQIKAHPITAQYYLQEKINFIKAIFLHTIGWIAGGIEMWAMFAVLGQPISLLLALIFESLLQMIRLASFFVPGNIGTQEAGMALLAQMAGMNPALGIALSLLKRLRQIVWTSIGFIFFGVAQK